MAGPIACFILVIALPAVPSGVRADTGTYTLTFENEFGQQLSDVGRTQIFVNPPDASPPTTHFGCGTTANVSGDQIVVRTNVLSGPPTSSDPCDTRVAGIFVGPLSPGVYHVDAPVISETGAMLADPSTSFTITPRGAKCNVDPFINGIIASPKLSLETFQSLFETNPGYRARFGDVAYVNSYVFLNTGYVGLAFPTLQDPVRELALLQGTGEFNLVEEDSIGCFTTPPPDAVGTVVEYHNTILDHYFMTPDAGEQAAIEAGKVGLGWVRTSNTFQVVVTPGCPVAHEGGFHPVYRFAGVPDIGPNSHFFTVSQDECAVVRDRTEWHWQFEGAPFWAAEPSEGVCQSERQPLYRAYNNGKGGTPNHRYSTDVAVVDSMVAQGWVVEGVAMCVLP